MDGLVIRCVLVYLAVLAVLQSVVGTGTHGHNYAGFSDECQRQLSSCIFAALEPYLYDGMSSEQALARARRTKITTHCTEWSDAMRCAYGHLRSKVCQNVTSVLTNKVIKAIELVDIGFFYACGEQEDEVDSIYRCVLYQEVYTTMFNRCSSIEPNKTNACETMPAVINCAARSIEYNCGSLAGVIAEDLGQQLSAAFVDLVFDRKCPRSSRFYRTRQRSRTAPVGGTRTLQTSNGMIFSWPQRRRVAHQRKSVLFG